MSKKPIQQLRKPEARARAPNRSMCPVGLIMPVCPQCNAQLRELVRRCPKCQADLDLLFDYVHHLQGGLERAQNLVQAGDLGQAVWAYLEILEVDPDNQTARRQVSQVVTAVRQFDLTAPGRRWQKGLAPLPAKNNAWEWGRWLLIGTLIVLAFVVGILVARSTGGDTSDADNDKQPQLPGRPLDHNRLGN